jgi:hypothetical protein
LNHFLHHTFLPVEIKNPPTIPEGSRAPANDHSVHRQRTAEAIASANELSNTKKRNLYTNDGHWSSSSSGQHSGHQAPNSWEDQDGGIFPQRNDDFPEPKFSQNLPSIQKPKPRVEIPIISAEQPDLEWLVSGNYSSQVVYGFPSYVVDKDLGSQLHLHFEEKRECYIVFNLRKAYQMAGVRISPAWSNGPKRVKLSFSAFLTGPWALAAESDVDGVEDGAYVMERWQGKVTQGYRNHNLKTTINFPAGFRLNGRFLRLDVLDIWSGVYEKSQAVIKEVEFFGEALVTSLANGEERLCAWPTVYSEEDARCIYLD